MASRPRARWAWLALSGAWCMSVAPPPMPPSDVLATLVSSEFHIGWTMDAVRDRWGPPDHISAGGEDDRCRHLIYAFRESRVVIALDHDRVVAVHAVARTSDAAAYTDARDRLATVLGPPHAHGRYRAHWQTDAVAVGLGGWGREFNLTATTRRTTTCTADW